MADPGGQTSGLAQSQDTFPTRGAPLRAEPGWAGPVYWPHASDDLFDYVFRGTGEGFWARGGRDLADAILMRDGKASEREAELCGGRQGDDVSAWQEPIAQAVQPTDARRGAFDGLKSALAEASKNIKAHCPAAKTVASPTQRLQAMTDRVWGMRQAVVLMRAPLEKFFGALDEQQRTRFTDAVAERRDAAADPAAANAWMQLCADPSAMAPWPNQQIERRLKPSNEQRQSFQTLQMTTQGMARQLMASCPKASPANPLDRLDAAEKRLNAMLYAVRVVGPALQAFYDSLSPEQKTRFTALGTESRTSRR